MKGQFSLSILEIFGYFIPGGLLVMSCIYKFNPIFFSNLLENNRLFVMFIIFSYLIGHVVAFMSGIITKLRHWIFDLLNKEKYLEKYVFYEKLKDIYKEKYGFEMSDNDLYLFSKLLVADKLPNCSINVERLYSLTHFSRNLVFVFFIISLLFINENILISIGSLLISLIFCFRYVYIGRGTTITALRSAYNYFIIDAAKEEKE